MTKERKQRVRKERHLPTRDLVVTPPQDNPGKVTLVKLTDAERQTLEHGLAIYAQEHYQRQRIDVAPETLDTLELGDWFVVRIARQHAFRVRVFLQRLAKLKGWYIALDVDPTSTPPDGYVDYYGRVEKRP